MDTIQSEDKSYANYLENILAKLKEEVQERRKSLGLDIKTVNKRPVFCKKRRQNQCQFKHTTKSSQLQHIRNLVQKLEKQVKKNSSHKLFQTPKKKQEYPIPPVTENTIVPISNEVTHSNILQKCSTNTIERNQKQTKNNLQISSSQTTSNVTEDIFEPSIDLLHNDVDKSFVDSTVNNERVQTNNFLPKCSTSAIENETIKNHKRKRDHSQSSFSENDMDKLLEDDNDLNNVSNVIGSSTVEYAPVADPNQIENDINYEENTEEVLDENLEFEYVDFDNVKEEHIDIKEHILEMDDSAKDAVETVTKMDTFQEDSDDANEETDADAVDEGGTVHNAVQKDKVDDDSSFADDNEFHDEMVSRIESNEFELTPELIEKLLDTDIVITWEIAPVHRIKMPIFGPGSKLRKDLIENHGAKFGYFVKAEDNLIKRNWEEFSDIYGFEDPKVFLYFRIIGKYFRYDKRQKFLQFLGRGLNNRALPLVYLRFRRMYSNFKAGRFARDEEKIIKFYSKKEHFGDRTVLALSKILNRDREHVCRKLQRLTSEKVPKVTWTREKLEIFLKRLIKITKVSSYRDLKNREITELEWKKMERKLKLPYRKLRRLWGYKFHVELFASEPILIKELHKFVVERLYEMKVGDWKEFNWNVIAKQIDGATNLFISDHFHHFVKSCVPTNLQKDFGEAVEYLYNRLGSLRIKNTRIQRYSFENGTLIELHH